MSFYITLDSELSKEDLLSATKIIQETLNAEAIRMNGSQLMPKFQMKI